MIYLKLTRHCLRSNNNYWEHKKYVILKDNHADLCYNEENLRKGVYNQWIVKNSGAKK